MGKSNPAARIAVFEPSLERLNLWLSVAFVPFVIFELLYPMSGETKASPLVNVTVGFVFLNYAHTAFTFVMLILMPELRAWARSRIASNMKDIQVTRGLAAVCVLGLIFTYFLFAQWDALVSEKYTWLGLLFAPMLYLRAHHIIGQVRGIASVYNAKGRAELGYSDAERAQVMRHEKLEQTLLKWIAAILVAGTLMKHYKLDYFRPWPIEWAGLAIAVLLTLNALISPMSRRTNKGWFLFRVVFISLGLTGYSAGASIACRSLHGIEYLGITQLMSSRSRWQLSKGRIIIVFVAAVALTCPMFWMFYSPNAQGAEWVTSQPLFKFLFALNFMREYGHYYMDAVLFRFREPEVRANIGPLLMDSSRRAEARAAA